MKPTQRMPYTLSTVYRLLTCSGKVTCPRKLESNLGWSFEVISRNGGFPKVTRRFDAAIRGGGSGLEKATWVYRRDPGMQHADKTCRIR